MAQISASLQQNFWPSSLAHLAEPWIAAEDERVTIAEISSDPVNGFAGNRLLFTALVPKDEVDQVLTAPGGIGTEVRCWGPRPDVDPEGGYDGSFWINGPAGSSKKYETIVNSWQHHNKAVLLPDNGLLMCYGLVPRVLKENGVAWDDPAKPAYDVIRVVPLSHYSIESGHTPSRITIRKDYLEDYLSLKGCVAVATFFEERYSSGDHSIEGLLGNQEIVSFDNLPGRILTLRRSSSRFGNQLSQVWGCSLMLAPVNRPISEEQEPALKWPDRPFAVTARDVRVLSRGLEYAYIRDEVLREYESRDEFDVSPESGSVSYNGWWAVSYGHRHSRNYLAIELRKLYEGVPVDVVRHYNRFAATSGIAKADRKLHGTRHIGNRGKDVVYGFLDLTSALAELSELVGLPATQEEIGGFNTADVRYRSWWTFPLLCPLGHVALMDMPRAEFFGCCTVLFKLIENIKPAPLRAVLIHLGMRKDAIRDFRSIKLLATLIQLAKIVERSGLGLVSEFEQVNAQWDARVKLPALSPLFALNSLRTGDVHSNSASTPARVSDALATFAIDESECVNGWGKALDRVYDLLGSSMTEMANSVRAIRM